MAAGSKTIPAGASPVITMAELCAYLSIHRPTLYRLIKDRKIPYFRVGKDYRFNREEIDPWLRAQEARPSAASYRRGRKPRYG